MRHRGAQPRRNRQTAALGVAPRDGAPWYPSRSSGSERISIIDKLPDCNGRRIGAVRRRASRHGKRRPNNIEHGAELIEHLAIRKTYYPVACTYQAPIAPRIQGAAITMP